MVNNGPAHQSISSNKGLPQTVNNLFPVFLKLEYLSVLVVGGGNVGLEKLMAIINNSPAATIKLVAVTINDAIIDAASNHTNIELIQRPFQKTDLDGIDVAIIAVNDPATSRTIRAVAKEKGKLVNVADQPDLCDFYLSSVVRKGNLKIAISTNGKSPTIAKRLKETFNELLPDKLDEVLTNMQGIRNQLKGDFASKVNTLNEVTKILSSQPESKKQSWKQIVLLIVFGIFCMILGHLVLKRFEL